MLSPARPSSPVTGCEAGPAALASAVNPSRHYFFVVHLDLSGAVPATHHETVAESGFRLPQAALGNGPHSQSPRGGGQWLPSNGAEGQARGWGRWNRVSGCGGG